MDTRGQTRKVKRLETLALTKEIADRLFFPEETVQAVLDVFFTTITRALLNEERVILRRFGVFRLYKKRTAKFRASSYLKQILKDHFMDKYGVEMNNEAVLMAKVTGQCPDCRQPLHSKDPPQCLDCGTKPFEKKEAKIA